MDATLTEVLAFDRDHIWHPYAPMAPTAPPLVVRSARGTRLTLADGREPLDAMSSWWAAIHGYRHPQLDEALHRQADIMSHVMFGGLTHEPAIEIGRRLIELAPVGLDKVFFADSGSVSVEVAIKMALQYWQGRGRPDRNRLLTVRGGYHGDTAGAMSVCDPVTGMHGLFRDYLAEQVFVERPRPTYEEPLLAGDLDAVRTALAMHSGRLAAVIVEPVVQGAGGMRFYSPDYLRELVQLCREAGLLVIFDEIATGFGRTGTLFAMEHAGLTRRAVRRQGTDRRHHDAGRHPVHRRRCRGRLRDRRGLHARTYLHGQPPRLRRRGSERAAAARR